MFTPLSVTSFSNLPCFGHNLATPITDIICEWPERAETPLRNEMSEFGAAPTAAVLQWMRLFLGFATNEAKNDADEGGSSGSKKVLRLQNRPNFVVVSSAI